MQEAHCHLQNVKDWAASPYGQLMKMCTEYTLSELRRHWVLYAEMHNLSPQRLKKIQSAFTVLMNSRQKGMVSSTARSAGPVMSSAIEVVALQFRNYWKKGTTSTNSSQTASLLNPTFCYSLAGEGCNVHYATDPIQPFHLAPLFGNTKRTVSVSDFVRAAQAEFKQWCTTFHSIISSTTIPSSASPVAVRFFLGDAMAVCRSIDQFAETGMAGSGIPVDQWKTQTITLNKAEGGYGHGPSSAPTTFDVIDTSNLCDQFGDLDWNPQSTSRSVEEDPEGSQGTFPLVVSFVMPTILLTELEPQEILSVSLALRSSTGSVEFVAKLGPMLRIFSAKLLDETHVHVLPEQARPFKMPPTLPHPIRHR
ncbi:hypothetical protein D9758_016043 [Tetrapyrgos nigripes]|uniref:Uncharacterized protein n=1 Tax=Tetrapyrgos nigripes TaxID=182062 RepID=A0A8H5FI77_9AGAR|nr:hypothetical protein D9758_016043 [Tetrapyrgos nigripes]